MLALDGRTGEGGGQILRSALTLSVITGRPFRIHDIRAGRRKPGLLRQHLTAVRAAARVGRATVTGAELHSVTITFEPSGLGSGDLRFSVGSAGSATLVAQTVLPALLLAAAPSSIAVEGGTHNMSAPPFEFLERSFLPLMRRMGARVEASLERAGFYPSGGGKLTLRVRPTGPLAPLALDDGGELRQIRVEAMVAGLPRSIAQREVATVSRQLAVRAEDLAVTELPAAWGPGNVVLVTVERAQVTEVFTGFGRRGVRAEQVGREAAGEARSYLDSGAAVGVHLADQLLLPLALAGGGSFTTSAVSRHMQTNAWVIEQFLPLEVVMQTDSRGRCRVEVRR
jgi:RNA 3'-terminal phosphate cyclase (ATP)